MDHDNYYLQYKIETDHYYERFCMSNTHNYSMINIIWIYDRPLNLEAGGTERITDLIAKGLQRRGYNCMGIIEFNKDSKSVKYDNEGIEDLYLFLNKKKITIVINQIAYSKWLLESFLRKGGEKWRNAGGKIISCLHFDPENPSLLYLYSSKIDKKLRDYFNIIKTGLLYPFYKYKQKKQEGEIYNFIYDNSDWFIVLSKTHFSYLHKVMQRTEYARLKAINNPLTFDGISSPATLIEKKKIAIVCARMSEYHKRISLILKAWKRIKSYSESKEWRLIIIGDGPDLQNYKQYVEAKHIPDILFVGQKTPESFYNSASLLLLTSSKEGWGLTITEAMQRGVIPIVMNSSPVFGEIINNGHDGFLTPDKKISPFVVTILNLMKSSDKYMHQIQNNALNSALKYNLDATINRWEIIINELI